jgi:hypothetical protein
LCSASSPSTHLLAMSIIYEIVLGLAQPSSSMKSLGCNQLLKESIALSSETFSAFFMMFQRCMYARIGSLDFYTHALNSSMDAGQLKVDLKLWMNLSTRSFYLLMDSSGSFVSHDLIAPHRCNCRLCMAVDFVPPCSLTVCN